MTKNWKTLVSYLWDTLSPTFLKARNFWRYTGKLLDWAYTSGDRWSASIRQILFALTLSRSPYAKRDTLEEDWIPIEDAGNHETRMAQREYRVFYNIRDVDALGMWSWMYPLLTKESYNLTPWQNVSTSLLAISSIKAYHLPMFYNLLRIYPSEEFLIRLVRLWGYKLSLIYPRFLLETRNLPDYQLSNTAYNPSNIPDYGIEDKPIQSTSQSARPYYILDYKQTTWLPRYVGSAWKFWFDLGEIVALLESELNDQVLDPAISIEPLNNIMKQIFPPYVTLYSIPVFSIKDRLTLATSIQITQL